MTQILPPTDLNTSDQTQVPLSLLPKDNATSSDFETTEGGEPCQGFHLAPRMFFIYLAIVLPLLTVATIIEVVFTELSTATDIMNWRTWEILDGGGRYRNGMSGAPAAIFNFPHHNTFKLASSYFSLGMCCIGAGMWWYGWKKGPLKTTYLQRFGIMAMFGVNAILALALTIYVFTIHGLSARFDMDYVRARTESIESSYFTYGKGIFDVESWSCGTKNLLDFDTDGLVHRTCSVEMGARFVTIFTFLFSSGLFALVWMDWRGGNLLMRTWKTRRASWRNDYV